ncbi:MAG: phosphatase PAP2 family protein [Chloroflexi bacterium]|nr:phosphatase PAP2 family protein [Chloroflexota bacterium]
MCNQHPMYSWLTLLIRRVETWDSAVSAQLALKAVEDQPHPPTFWPALLLAHLGDSWLWVLIAGLLFKSAYRSGAEARRRRMPLLWTWLISLIAATMATLWVKRQIKRSRPGKRPLLYGRGADVHSFPSGHAARLGAIAVWGNLLWPKWAWLTWVLAAGVGWSRVALGIHYVGDVAAGWVLGGMIGLFFQKLDRQNNPGKGVK